MSRAWIEAGWPAPPGVRAVTTRRFGRGVSQAPFDTFNLGSRCGDEAGAVAEGGIESAGSNAVTLEQLKSGSLR